MILQEIDSIIARDPAAKSRWDVFFFSSGFHAVLAYRLGHWLWRVHLRFLARLVMHGARFFTGIEIHPAARIGKHFFIDHGMGVVIGETSDIGERVTLYHGVTLGGVSPATDSLAQRDTKRHPTLEDDVIVGAGASILGPITIGRAARVGANAVAVKNVPPKAILVGPTGRILEKTARRQKAENDTTFKAYGTPLGEMADPVAKAIAELRARLDAIEKQAPSPARTVRKP